MKGSLYSITMQGNTWLITGILQFPALQFPKHCNSRLNRTDWPSPSLLNTVYSEAGWFGVIFSVIRQAYIVYTVVVRYTISHVHLCTFLVTDHCRQPPSPSHTQSHTSVPLSTLLSFTQKQPICNEHNQLLITMYTHRHTHKLMLHYCTVMLTHASVSK